MDNHSYNRPDCPVPVSYTHLDVYKRQVQGVGLMANMGGFSVAGMKKLQKQLNKIQQCNVEAFIDACAKELAARLLAKVIKLSLIHIYY